MDRGPEAWELAGNKTTEVKDVVMRLTGLETSIVAVIVGAIIGFVPSYLMERRRERSLLRSRWDSALFDLCSDFASSAADDQLIP